MTDDIDTILHVPQGTLSLRRYPLPARNDSLRAWDAADEYLLQHVVDEGWKARGHVWVLNDAFGALTTALATAGARVSTSSDSWISQEGTRHNLLANGQQEAPVQYLTSLDAPLQPVDAVLLKVPKSLALLEDQLHRVRQHVQALGSATVQIAAGAMARDVHTSTLELCSALIGPTRTSLARRKARLILCDFEMTLSPPPNPHPTAVPVAPFEQPLHNHAGVFSRQRLDDGTAQLLAHVPAGGEARRIVDLGCGNGVLGLAAARCNPRASLTFIDESFMAIASARHNWQMLFPGREATFVAGDGAQSLDDNSTDLILCNPPFHQHNARSDATAWRMFTGAKRVLRRGGKLHVVGNRHLAYHAKLRRLFGNCEVLASDRRFVVLRSQA